MCHKVPGIADSTSGFHASRAAVIAPGGVATYFAARFDYSTDDAAF
jgi:hypothetical protein